MSQGHAEGHRAADFGQQALARSQTLRSVGRISEALHVVDEALARYPGDYDLVCERAIVLGESEGCRSEALRTAEQAVSMDPEQAFGYQVLASILAGQAASPRSRAATRAVEVAGRAAELSNGSPGTLTTLAYVLRTAGRRAEARAVALQAASAAPDDVGVLLELARCARDLRNVSEVRQIAESILAIDPENAAAHTLLGQSLARHGRSAAAAKELAEAKRLDPHSQAGDADLRHLVVGRYGIAIVFVILALAVATQSIPIVLRVIGVTAVVAVGVFVVRRQGRVSGSVVRAVRAERRRSSPLKGRLIVLVGFLTACGSAFTAAGQNGWLEPQWMPPSQSGAIVTAVIVVLIAPATWWWALVATDDVLPHERATFDRLMTVALLLDIAAVVGSIAAVVRAG